MSNRNDAAAGEDGDLAGTMAEMVSTTLHVKRMMVEAVIQRWIWRWETAIVPHLPVSRAC
jgi:hypothetical protein